MAASVLLKPVMTLDTRTLAKAMADLWARLPSTTAQPDGIVGIATGGLICAQVLNTSLELPLFSCALRRPSTVAKSNPRLRKVLAMLPYAVTNWLRRLEDWVLARRTVGPAADHAQKNRLADETLTADITAIAEKVQARGLRHLVVIDDALDSGFTLGTVIAKLRSTLPQDVLITSAVIAQTRPDPIYKPDVALFLFTLCRFPWSFDFRGTREECID